MPADTEARDSVTREEARIEKFSGPIPPPNMMRSYEDATMKEYVPTTNRLHLVPTPTVWTGIGSLFDICGVLNTYTVAHSGERADYEALRSDWLAVGDYITEAIILRNQAIEKERGSEQYRCKQR